MGALRGDFGGAERALAVFFQVARVARRDGFLQPGDGGDLFFGGVEPRGNGGRVKVERLAEISHK